MSKVRKAIAAAAVVGALVAAPVTMVASQSQQASVGGVVTMSGGQGSWPFKP